MADAKWCLLVEISSPWQPTGGSCPGPRNCLWSFWSDWSKCTCECLGGGQVAKRAVQCGRNLEFGVLQAKHQVSEIVKKETQTSGPDHLGSSAGVWVTMAYCNSRWGWERSQWQTWAACFVQCNLMAPQGWINASKRLGRRASPIRPLGSEWVGQRELDTYQIITYLWSSMTLASLKR